MTNAQGNSLDSWTAIECDEAQRPLGLEQTLVVLRRRALLIGLCALLLCGGALLISLGQARRYTASAMLVFDGTQINQQIAGLPAMAGYEPKAEQDTNVKLLEIGRTAAQVAGRIGPPLSAEDVSRSVAIVPQGESNVVAVEATASSPRLAARIANLYARRFVADRIGEEHRYFAHARALVMRRLHGLSASRRAGAEGLALQDRAQSLAILVRLRSGEVEVAQRASAPSGPSSPKLTRNAILGAVLGLLLGVGLAFLLERLDRRIKEPEDLQEAYGLPLLGVVPESEGCRRLAAGAASAAGVSPLPAAELEALRMLRAKLRYFNVDRELRAVLITSEAPADGKTTLALGLAEAAASMGERVLIVEADLRRPVLAKALAVRERPGLADTAIAAATLGEALQTVALGGYACTPEVAGSGGLDVLVAGAEMPNPTALLESAAIERTLRQAADEYDLVLVDTPPLAVVSDAIPLLGRVDGVIVVGRLGRSRKDRARRLLAELRGLRAPLLGVVANGRKRREAPLYGYGYEDGHSVHAGGCEPRCEPVLH